MKVPSGGVNVVRLSGGMSSGHGGHLGLGVCAGERQLGRGQAAAPGERAGMKGG